MRAETAPAADFWDDAACLGVDPDLFYPERGQSTKDAKAVCSSCAVRAECLDYALATNQKFGIWGGTSERERRRIKKARRQRLSLVKEEPMTIGTVPGSDLEVESGPATNGHALTPNSPATARTFAARSCGTCGESFVPVSPNQRYCSMVCRPSKTAASTQATCRSCGKTFESRSGARYCSRKCTMAADEQPAAAAAAPARAPAIPEDRDPPWLAAFLAICRSGEILEITVVTRSVTHTMKATPR